MIGNQRCSYTFWQWQAMNPFGTNWRRNRETGLTTHTNHSRFILALSASHSTPNNSRPYPLIHSSPFPHTNISFSTPGPLSLHTHAHAHNHVYGYLRHSDIIASSPLGQKCAIWNSWDIFLLGQGGVGFFDDERGFC